MAADWVAAQRERTGSDFRQNGARFPCLAGELDGDSENSGFAVLALEGVDEGGRSPLPGWWGWKTGNRGGNVPFPHFSECLDLGARTRGSNSDWACGRSPVYHAYWCPTGSPLYFKSIISAQNYTDELSLVSINR